MILMFDACCIIMKKKLPKFKLIKVLNYLKLNTSPIKGMILMFDACCTNMQKNSLI